MWLKAGERLLFRLGGENRQIWRQWWTGHTPSSVSFTCQPNSFASSFWARVCVSHRKRLLLNPIFIFTYILLIIKTDRYSCRCPRLPTVLLVIVMAMRMMMAMGDEWRWMFQVNRAESFWWRSENQPTHQRSSFIERKLNSPRANRNGNYTSSWHSNRLIPVETVSSTLKFYCFSRFYRESRYRWVTNRKVG